MSDDELQEYINSQEGVEVPVNNQQLESTLASAKENVRDSFRRAVEPLQKEKPSAADLFKASIQAGAAQYVDGGDLGVVGNTLRDLGIRVPIQSIAFPYDVSIGIGRGAQRFAESVLPEGWIPNEGHIFNLPTSGEILENIMGESPIPEAESSTLGGMIGFAAGGPIAGMIGSAVTPLFDVGMEWIEDQDWPEPIKSSINLAASVLPAMGHRSKSAIKGTIERKIPSMVKAEGLRAQINPLEIANYEPVNPLRVSEGGLRRPEGQRTALRGGIPEVPVELPKPAIEPFEFVKEDQLNSVIPEEMSRLDVGEILSDINQDTRAADTKATSALYDRVTEMGNAFVVDASQMVRDMMSHIYDETKILPVERAGVRTGVMQTLEALGVNKEFINIVRDSFDLQNFIEGSVTEESLSRNVKEMLNDMSPQEAAERLKNSILDMQDAELTNTTASHLIRAEQNLNRLIDFDWRDPEKKSQPNRKLNPVRDMVKDNLRRIQGMDEGFGRELDAARESHAKNVDLYGTDFNRRLQTKESVAGVVAKDLTSVDAAVNIEKQIKILDRSEQGKAFIPNFERTVLNEIFADGKWNFQKEELWKDVRRRLSPQAQQAGDYLQQTVKMGPIEQSLSSGRFYEKTLNNMSTVKGLQNERLRLREAAERTGVSDLTDIYEKQFTKQNYETVFDPLTEEIKPDKIKELRKNQGLKNALDEINGPGSTDAFLDVQENVLSIAEKMDEARQNQAKLDKTVDRKFFQNQEQLRNVFENIRVNPEMTITEKITAFKDAFQEIFGKPATAGDIWTTSIPFMGKFLSLGNKGLGIVNLYNQKIGGSPASKRLKSQTASLRKTGNKITRANMAALGATYDSAIKKMGKNDPDFQEKVLDTWIKQAFER